MAFEGLHIGDSIRLKTNEGPKMLISSFHRDDTLEAIYWVESENCFRFMQLNYLLIKKTDE